MSEPKWETTPFGDIYGCYPRLWAAVVAGSPYGIHCVNFYDERPGVTRRALMRMFPTRDGAVWAAQAWVDDLLSEEGGA